MLIFLQRLIIAHIFPWLHLHAFPAICILPYLKQQFLTLLHVFIHARSLSFISTVFNLPYPITNWLPYSITNHTFSVMRFLPFIALALLPLSTAIQCYVGSKIVRSGTTTSSKVRCLSVLPSFYFPLGWRICIIRTAVLQSTVTCSGASFCTYVQSGSTTMWKCGGSECSTVSRSRNVIEWKMWRLECRKQIWLIGEVNAFLMKTRELSMRGEASDFQILGNLLSTL